MNGLKPINKLVCLIIFMILVISCGTEDNKLRKTTDFVPGFYNYEFYIEGEIEDKILHYKQVNFDNSNTSNTFFKQSQSTWLQAYADGINFDGSWRIRFHGLNIEAIELPYNLKPFEGSIAWDDSRVDKIIKDTESCQGIDSGCTFSLIPEGGTITITKVKDQIIEGNFMGKATLVRTGFNQSQDLNHLYQEIENGKFRINYRVD